MKLKPAQEYKGPGIFHYWCPGCKCEHSVFTQFKNDNGAQWQWNGDMERPTFKPSLLMTWDSKKTKICHVFITDGKIQFLSDCTHELAGKTVDLPDIPGDI
jgi:hypothetical protein